MSKLSWSTIFVAGSLGGCAIHPLPEDVTRDTTTAIVKKIRCEARQSLDNLTINLLREGDDPILVHYADMIQDGSLKATDLLRYKERYDLKRLSQKQLKTFIDYTLSAVTFDFQFMITEGNQNGATVDLSVPFVSRIFTVNGQANANFQRQNTRKFLVTNTFWELHDLDRVKDCGDATAVVGNVIYPITGKIGLQEVFNTFIEIDSSAGSTKRPEKKEELFTDNLLFTTTLSASITPKIALNPVTSPTSGLLRVPDASITESASRVDAHQVAISIARGDLLTTYEAAVKASKPYTIEKARQNAKQKSVAIAQQNRVNFFFINQQTIYNRLGIQSPYGY